MTQHTLVFDKSIPIPRRAPRVYDTRRAYIIGKESVPLSQALRKMEVGDSCLLSHWASTSVHYVAKKEKMKFKRQQQPDGTIRIWRIA